MTARLRPCSAEDVEVLRELARRTYEETFASRNTRENMERYCAQAFGREKLLSELRDPRPRYSFLELDGRIVGYLKLNEAPAQTDVNDPDSLEIERIYVEKEYQGRGLGRFMVDHTRGLARQAGKTYIWLGVWEENTAALAFYERLGFVPMGRHEFGMGDEVQLDILMRLAVAPGGRTGMADTTRYSIHSEPRFGPRELMDVKELASRVADPWFNQTLCRVNDSVVRVGVFRRGEFHWHRHEREDELFFVLEGEFTIELEREKVVLRPHQGSLVPRGVLHRTSVGEAALILMVEAASVKPTGD
jgi:ribosomal protein S18 acetylase RimI-like enzyme